MKTETQPVKLADLKTYITNNPTALDLDLWKGVADWMERVEAIRATYYSTNFPRLTRPALAVDSMKAPKYIRIIDMTYPDAPTRQDQQRSAFAFIDRVTGDVLKTDGWKGPAKGARGNIRDPNRLGVDPNTGRVLYNK